MRVRATGWTDDRVYGAAAAVFGCFLVWYAFWTLACTPLVLLGAHYPAVEWALAIATLSALPVGWRLAPVVAAAYRGSVDLAPSSLPSARALDRPAWTGLGLILLAALPTLVAAQIGMRTEWSVPYMLVTIFAAMVLGWGQRRGAFAVLAPEALAIGWRLPVLLVLLFGIYYFSHRIDGDDANFVNLAWGAQRTAHGVFQVDTMLGDGPHPIHLPSYKFHTFELLGAVLSSWLGLTPLAVFHLVIPAIEIPVLACLLLLVFGAASGRFWLAASLAWIGFLFANEVSVGGWGLHGLVRFFQGKGFLVSALLPAIAAMTVRWFRRGERIDLLGLLLANICAVGFSANGIYDGPAASGFVALAFLARAPRAAVNWRRAAALLPTFAWPLIAMVLIVLLHLALPSEVMEKTYSVGQLDFVVWYGVIGRVTLMGIALMALALLGTGIAAEALLFVPLAMIVALNPASWDVISAVTGNLGFRIFWALPVPILLSLTYLAAVRLAGVRTEAGINAAGALALLGCLAYLGANPGPITTIYWHWPDLKVNRPDYDRAERLAGRTGPGCSILAPEIEAVLLSMIRDAPHPVFVRQLYLTHYRFTMPRDELVLRNRLRLVVDGPAGTAVPTRSDLRLLSVPIGTVAVRADAPSRRSAAALSHELGLPGPVADGPLLIWSGACRS